ncbi:MAG: hypothetical protein A3D89_01030 [Planctomycetes bacterium RIFCSPHIGHO2_02_FULL_52_58]|nr:MAG: hypothetical protein A3D89_01030 [Planctomycetes bacterium RIFCSPHIGHO2_02_FULL_52_58]
MKVPYFPLPWWEGVHPHPSLPHQGGGNLCDCCLRNYIKRVKFCPNFKLLGLHSLSLCGTLWKINIVIGGLMAAGYEGKQKHRLNRKKYVLKRRQRKQKK